MAIEQVKKLLEAIKSDPKAQELLQGVSEPKSEEDMIRLCAEIAPKLGFDVTEADIREAVAAMSRERMEKTAADVEKLPDDDVAQAAGGALWHNEDAPDGHEYGCVLCYHSEEWQIQNGYSCNIYHLCPVEVLATYGTLESHPNLCTSMYYQRPCENEYQKF